MNEKALSHEDVDGLLPWHANETLDEAERHVVGEHLIRCAECRESLALLLQMKDSLNDHQAIAMVPEPRLAELLDKLDQNERAGATLVMTQPWLIAASIAILAITAVLLFTGRQEQRADPQFRTVTTAEQIAEVSYVMNLTLAAGTTDVSRSKLLQELGATVLATTASDSMQIVIPMQAVSMTELERIMDDLRLRPEISAASVVALQLPVRKDD